MSLKEKTNRTISCGIAHYFESVTLNVHNVCMNIASCLFRYPSIYLEHALLNFLLGKPQSHPLGAVCVGSLCCQAAITTSQVSQQFP